MSKAPTVSVILPTFNREKFIVRSLRSVVNQSFHDMEIIVVDDCSSDDTKDVVAGFEDPRIKYIKHTVNKGGGAARNTGIGAAQGEFIAFQDSDDEWVLDKLEKQMQVMLTVKSDVAVVYSAYLWVTGSEVSYVPLNAPPPEESEILAHILKRNFVDTSTAVVRKKYFDKFGLFDEDLPRYQDWDLFIRLAKHLKFSFVDEPLVISHCLKGGISTNDKAAITARKMIFEKNRSEITRDSRLLANFLFETGTLCCKNDQFGEGRGYIFRAMKSYGLDTRYWLPALVSLFGQKAYLAASRITSRV